MSLAHGKPISPAAAKSGLQARVGEGRQHLLPTLPPIHLPPREWQISLLEMSQGISTQVVIYASTANELGTAPKRVHRHGSSAAASTPGTSVTGLEDGISPIQPLR